MGVPNSTHAEGDPFTSGTRSLASDPIQKEPKESSPLVDGEGHASHYDSMVLAGQEADPLTSQAKKQMGDKEGELDSRSVVEDSTPGDDASSSVQGQEPFTPSGRKVMDSDTLKAGGESRMGNMPNTE